MKRGFVVFFFVLGGLGVSFTPLFAQETQSPQETQDTLPEALTGVELPPELVLPSRAGYPRPRPRPGR